VVINVFRTDQSKKPTTGIPSVRVECGPGDTPSTLERKEKKGCIPTDGEEKRKGEKSISVNKKKKVK